ncbi:MULTISPECIES: ABC transporter permease DevC [Spirulina sp. CCY15215]|uniref:ABC transporter permease DevC n=1 Tax=Spirulina sp. CCY15215 TaxID=2767591 RepID=UPI00194EF5F6|nr:ABC transporter permease DevC [Spirulina major]
MLKQLILSFQKIPIAFLQLQHQKSQTLAAILGIAFSVVLLFMQIGFYSAFLDGFIELPQSFQGEIFLLNTWSREFLTTFTFSSRHLYQTLKFPEVESVTPIYRGMVFWRNSQDKTVFHRGIMVLGIPLDSDAIALPGVKENLDKIKAEKMVLFDRKARPNLAYITQEFQKNGVVVSEINVPGSGLFQKIQVKGLFELGANTTIDASLIVSESTFSQLFHRNLNDIDLGIIKLKEGTDINKTIAKLQKYLPLDIKVYSKPDFIAYVKEFYEHGTAMGIIFRFALIGSIVVGIVILYQILYQKVSKHLPEYATLKAIGYSHQSLVIIVLEEAFLLAFLGYIPGLILSVLVYDFLAKSTSMSIFMQFNTVLSVLLLTCGICLISASLAVQKLKEVDPVEIFS